MKNPQRQSGGSGKSSLGMDQEDAVTFDTGKTEAAILSRKEGPP